MARYLLVAVILFVVYNTLIPFRPYASFNRILRQIYEIEFIPFVSNGRFVGLTDIVGNVLLFLPIGFLARIVFDHKLKSILWAVSLGLALSLFVELSQIFLHYRIASVGDLMTNTLGAWAGAAMASLFLKRWYRSFLLYVRTVFTAPWESVLFVAIGFYLLAFLWISLLTSARLSVNAQAVLSWNNLIPAFLFFILGLFYMDGKRLWDLFPKGRPLFVGFLFFVPLILSSFYNLGLFFWSGAASVLGYSIGRFSNWAHQKRLVIGLVLISGYILLDNLQPFVFSGLTSRSVAIKGFVPFYHYYKMTSIWNINDLLQILLEGFLFGKIIGAISHNGMQTKIMLAIGFVLSLGMETAQLFIRGRTMDITDVGMFVLGLWVAAFIVNYRRLHSGQDADNQVEKGGQAAKKQSIR